MPVHCIGVQAYLRPNELSLPLMAYRLDRLNEVGLEVYITEHLWWNVVEPIDGNLTSTMDEPTLSGMYESFMTAWFSHPAVKGMLSWGFWDGQIWANDAGLFFKNKTEKLAGKVRCGAGGGGRGGIT